MAQKTSIFQGVLDAINGNNRKKTQDTNVSPGVSTTTFSPQQGNIEEVQQQYLDWQSSKIAHDLYTRTIFFDTSRLTAYQDFRAMDMSPEIAAALNIIRDECLEASTIVPLLNGEKITIEDLYKSNKKNFYVYSYNPDLKKFEPGLCERVTYKGEQNVYKIIFDDDSYIMATSEHLWLTKGENKYLKTSELTEGQSLEPFYSRISNENDRIKGYEMLFESGKWEYTHRIVKREIFPNEKGVVHHKNIKKLNNDPSNLKVMTWFKHQELHHKLNSERWENDIEYSTKMRQVFSKTNSADGPYWSNAIWKEKRVKEMSDRSTLKYSSYSQEELNNIFSYPGELNPMYGQGHKLKGEKNGRYLKDKKREFTLEELLYAFDNSNNIEEACEILNTTRRILYKSKAYKELNIHRWEDLGFYKNNININTIEYSCKKYLGKLLLEKSLSLISQENGWIPKRVNTFLIKNGFGNWTSYVKKYNSKKCILENIKKAAIVHSTHNISEICRKEGYSRKQIEGLISRSEYKNCSNLLETVNHKVKSVEFVGRRKTYDLINVGKHSNFSVLTSNGTGLISHNCLTRNERGNILEVYSENIRVKKALIGLFKNKLNIDYNLRLWIRDLIKYGDYFVHLHIDKETGIYDFMTLPMEEMHREEGHDGKIDSVRFRWETKNEYFEEWQIAHFRMIEDTKKLPYGRCLKFDTYIDTVNGPKFIKDITKEDVVWSFNTETQSREMSKVLDVVCSGEKEIYKIRTKNNEIESSAEHNIMICEKNQFIYKSVSELKLNDLLVVNKKFETHEKIKINKNFNFNLQNYNGYRNSSNNIPEYVDVEFAKLFGFMLGDGWISNNAVYIALGIDEDINNEYIRLLEKFSGKKIILKANQNKEGKTEYSQAWVNSKMLKEILILNGFKGKCWEKRLPNWIFKSEDNIKEAIIQGLVDSDGSINVDEFNCKRYSLEVVSEYLVKDLKYLLQTMGRKTGKICTRQRKKTKIWGKEYKTRQCFYLYFYDSFLKQSNNCDFQNRKNDDFIIVPIVSIEKTECKSYVYDIHVESKNHNFFANGIVVHNSMLDSARKLWKQLQLAEDAMLVYRITRAPERRVFYIEVGNLDDNDVTQYIQRVQNRMKKQPVVDQHSGNYNMKYNPMNVTEDYYIPIRGEKSSKIDTLPGACLALNTKIELLDGRSLELKDIINEFNSGKELWSYSINPNTGEIVPGKITWAGITRKNTEVVKITLDNGETITCTPDHKFPTRFNGKKEAKNLTVGESLWSFNKKFAPVSHNTRKKRNDYEMIYDHKKNDWIFTHKFVANFFKTIEEHNEIVYNEKYINEKIKRGDINKVNFKKSPNKLQELLKDESYKKEFYEKISAALKKVKNTTKCKNRQSEFAKLQWRNESFRKDVIEKQTIKYSENMLQFVVNKIKNGSSAEDILIDINMKNSLFMVEFNYLNSNNKQLLKMKNGFTHNNLSKMMQHFGYKNWRDFKNKVECFNHKIVSIEFLSEKQDTGTITIDGKEKYHDFHNFALTCGVFTNNSNLGEIQDIEYLQNKLFASLQVPKTYLNYAENLPGGSTLSQADLRFARTINSIQEAVLLELRRIANIHLYFLGFTDDIDNFTLSLTNPSTQQELLKLETMKARLEVFKEMFSADATSPVSYTWAMENILGFSKSDIKLILKQKKVEKKIFAEIDSAVETYKKIGLFKELDNKYELPGAPQTTSGEGGAGEEAAPSGGGGGGGGFGGGFELPGAGAPGAEPGIEAGAELGGVPEVGAEAGGGVDAGGAAGAGAGGAAGGGGLAESGQRKYVNKLMQESDTNAYDLIDSLLGSDENKKEIVSEENALLKSNKELNVKAEKLIQSLNQSFTKEEKAKEVLKESEEGSDNDFLKNNEDMLSNSKEIMEKLDKLFGNANDSEYTVKE